jgi:uncharacterized protein (DUF2235 family)
VSKNVVLCLDGTNNKIKAQKSNVLMLYQAIVKDPARQAVYYQPGVGTFSSPGTWTPAGRTLTRSLGSVFGFGFRQNLGDAYRFVMANYEPDDQIYIFGFSRGAYTARALVGMLDMYGVFRPGAENLVPHAVDHYTVRRAREKDRARKLRDRDERDRAYWERVRDYANTLSVKRGGHVGVHFLGLWDTVNAIGMLRGEIKLPYAYELPHVGSIRHAIAIDERRWPYRWYRIKDESRHKIPPARGSVEQVWFAGVHSYVGGAFAYEPGNWIWRIPLLWMAREASGSGLFFTTRGLRDIERSVTPELATGRVHTMGGKWRLMYGPRRTLPEGARVHASVRDRLAVDPGYARKQLPDGGHVWVDEDWLRHHANVPVD